MDRNRQDLGFAVERVLGPVSMVDVPVENRHATNLFQSLRPANRYRNVAEDAESTPGISRRMMSGGACEDINVVDCAVQNGLQSACTGTGSEPDDVIGIGPDPRPFADIASAFFADRLNLRDVLRRMAAQQVLFFSRLRLDGDKSFGQ